MATSTTAPPEPPAFPNPAPPTAEVRSDELRRGPKQSDRRFVALVLTLGLLTSLSRIPFRSQYLFSWDSANFALALDQYNVAFHQPQPPGYPLYVATAWLARLLVRDANTSYVALSIATS